MSGTLRLKGSTSGYSELQAPAVAGDQTFILPAAGGTLLTTDSPAPTLTLESGTVTSPSLTFEGDSNTGIYSPGANQLAITTDGSQRLIVNNIGRVGIGTASPDAQLKVQSPNSDSITSAFAVRQNNAADSAQATCIIEQDPLNSSSRIIANGTTTPSLKLGTASTVAVTINSSQQVGIGTSSPNSLLHVDGEARFGTSEQLRLTAAGTIAYIDAINSGGSLAFRTNAGSGAAEHMRIDSSGRVGIGTSSATRNLEIKTGTGIAGFKESSSSLATTLEFLRNGAGTITNNAIEVSNTGGIAASVNYSGGAYFGGNVGIGTLSPIAQVTALGINSGGEGGTMCIQNTATGVNTSVALYLTPNNGGGNDLLRTAAIKSRQDTSGNYATLEFYTAASNTPTERARFDSAGRFMIGKTTWGWNNPGFQTEANEGQAVTITNDGSFSVKHCLGLRRDNSDGAVAAFYRGSTTVGSINVTSSNTSYVTTSDYRLKENIIDLDGAIDRVKQLAPKRFNFIVDADTTVDGFLAHEAQSVVPEAVVGSKDEVDDDGNAVMQGIDQSKLVPLLTAALKEAISKIETLEQSQQQLVDFEARLSALETAN